MNGRNNGDKLEREIRERYNLSEDVLGFDGSLNGIPIEIKGCIRIHKNGVDSKGRDKRTKGRFWINNRDHSLLVKEKGLYIFAVYEMFEEDLLILEYDILSAKRVNRQIGDGGNTKIRYDVIFPHIHDWRL